MFIRIPVYILAGGRSSRFGSDKARADLDGRAMLVRLADMLGPAASGITVVAAGDGKYHDLGLGTIGDEVPGLGPLGGLLTALKHRHAADGPGWLLLSACDWAEVRLSWVQTLWALADDTVDAVAFCDDCWQPLFALYHTRAAATVQDCLDRHLPRMRDLLGRLSARAVRPPEDWSMLFQINTRADRDRYLACHSVLPVSQPRYGNNQP